MGTILTSAIERQTPWRTIGTGTASSGKNVAQAMEAAGLHGWDLRKMPLVHLDPISGPVEVPDTFINLRKVAGQTKPRPVGVVGDRYWNIPNEVVGEFIQTVVDEDGSEHGIYVDAAGELEGGKRAYVTLGLKDSSIEVGGWDTVHMYLNAIWSHDGSTPVLLFPSPTRFSCTNQVRGLTRGSRTVYRVRHLSGAGDLSHKVEEAREALKVTGKYVLAMQDEASALLAKKATDAQFFEIMGLTFPEIVKAKEGDLTGRALTMAENRTEEIWGIWNSDTVAGQGISNTAWGALQSIGEYVDWVGSVKGSGTLGDADARARRAMVNGATVETVKERARLAVAEILAV